MINKEITISGVQVPFKASATVPRLYRAKFQRDIFKDMIALAKSYDEEKERQADGRGGSGLPINDLEMFENIAYIMAYHANPKVPASVEDWLEQFDTFDIYTVLPQIVEMWHMNTATQIEAKKNLGRVAAKRPTRSSC